MLLHISFDSFSTQPNDFGAHDSTDYVYNLMYCGARLCWSAEWTRYFPSCECEYHIREKIRFDFHRSEFEGNVICILRRCIKTGTLTFDHHFHAIHLITGRRLRKKWFKTSTNTLSGMNINYRNFGRILNLNDDLKMLEVF